MSGSPLAASLQHYVLADAGFRRHMHHVRARLQEKQARTIKRLKVIGVTPWIEPSGGNLARVCHIVRPGDHRRRTTDGEYRRRARLLRSRWS